uniref:Thioredoxin domain-containing protein n=2 Tax=Octopus bimaculoides TaxID=37653 RepID=A0A0L8FFV6_OCTBM
MDVHNLSLTVLSAIFFLLLVPLSCVAQKGKAISLTDDNWNQVLEGEWMIKFMAPWCPACQSFKDIWENYTSWAEDLNIHVAIVDVTQNPGSSLIWQSFYSWISLPNTNHSKSVVGAFYVPPAQRPVRRIKRKIPGHVFANHFPHRRGQFLHGFYSWMPFQMPTTPQSGFDAFYVVSAQCEGWCFPLLPGMSSLSLFFKAAMFIRSLYSTMTEVYGIPEWGCYVIFALATLLVGFIAGMLIVCCVDLLFPVSVQSLSKPAPHPSHVARQKEDREDREKDDESDIVDDTAGSKETLRQRNPQQQQQQPTQDE